MEQNGETIGFPRDLMLLDGEWTLAFSSTLAGPAGKGVPDLLFDSPLSDLVASSPLLPREVEQTIDVNGRRVVNCLSLAPWPAGKVGEALSSALGPLGGVVGDLQRAAVRLELDHSFSVEGEGSGGRRQAAAGSKVDVRLEVVRRSLDGVSDDAGGLTQLIPKASEYSLPAPLDMFASGSFDTPYVDEQLRVSRGCGPGPRELRVFVRKAAPAAAAGEEAATGAAEEGGELDQEVPDDFPFDKVEYADEDGNFPTAEDDIPSD